MPRLMHGVLLVVVSFAASPALGVEASLATAPATQQASRDSSPVIRAFYRQIMLNDYDRVGRRNEKWDSAARAMLAAAADQWAPGATPNADELDIIYHASRVTRKAGCDDPLVLYVTSDNLSSWPREPEVVSEYIFRASETMQTSGYHPLLKCRVLIRAAQHRARAKENLEASLDRARKDVDAALALLPQVVADRAVPRYCVYSLFNMIAEVSTRLANDREAYVAGAFKVLDEQCQHDRSLVLTVMARFYTDFAWDGRTQAFADKLTEENVKLFQERMAPARLAAEEAWKLDNANAYAAAAMLRICLAVDEEQLDTWYDRVIQADPDSWIARQLRLLSLEPKWYGSIDKMLAFARACAEEGRWEAGIPLLLVEAHLDASRYTEARYMSKPQPAYFKDNPQAWNDIHRVYGEYLKRFPESLYHRCRYAQLAAWCGQWAEADRQFKAMGEKFSYAYFRNSAAYRKLRAEVSHKLHEPATSP